MLYTIDMPQEGLLISARKTQADVTSHLLSECYRYLDKKLIYHILTDFGQCDHHLLTSIIYETYSMVWTFSSIYQVPIEVYTK